MKKRIMMLSLAFATITSNTQAMQAAYDWCASLFGRGGESSVEAACLRHYTDLSDYDNPFNPTRLFSIVEVPDFFAWKTLASSKENALGRAYELMDCVEDCRICGILLEVAHIDEGLIDKMSQHEIRVAYQRVIEDLKRGWVVVPPKKEDEGYIILRKRACFEAEKVLIKFLALKFWGGQKAIEIVQVSSIEKDQVICLVIKENYFDEFNRKFNFQTSAAPPLL